MSSPSPVPVEPAPVEAKVKASSVVSLLVTVVAFVVHFYWPGFASLPDALQTVIGAGVVALCTFAAGYIAKHTPRDLSASLGVDFEELAVQATEALPDYREWLKVDLHDEAQARGLKVSGTKAELVRRLRKADRDSLNG